MKAIVEVLKTAVFEANAARKALQHFFAWGFIAELNACLSVGFKLGETQCCHSDGK